MRVSEGAFWDEANALAFQFAHKVMCCMTHWVCLLPHVQRHSVSNTVCPVCALKHRLKTGASHAHECALPLLWCVLPLLVCLPRGSACRQVDASPFAVRTSVFHEIGGWDETSSAPGAAGCSAA